MKQIIYTLLFILLTLNVVAQTTLFTETFNNGDSNWTLNSDDLGGLDNPNSWVVNNAYQGGTVMLLLTIPNTSNQPSAITGYPQSNYLHILSSLASMNGIFNSCFYASGGSSYFAKMNNSINTSGYNNVTLKFWWLCAGGPQSVGEVYYRTSSTGNWTLITNPIASYNNTTIWTQQTISLPVYNNQPFLQFAYRFRHDATGNDPAFAVDEITVTGTPAGTPPPVANFTINNTTICAGQCVQLTSTSTGQIDSYQWTTPGGTPTTSTNSNVTVCYNLPGTYNVSLSVTNAGGTDTKLINNAITVNPAPTLTVVNDTVCKGQTAVLTASGANSYIWSPATGLNSTTGSSVNATIATTTTYVVSGTGANGCTASTQVVAYIYPNATGNISGLNSSYYTNSTPITLTGTPAGGTFSGSGISGNVFNPSVAGAGTHTIIYSFTDTHGCTSSVSVTVTVSYPVGVNDLNNRTSYASIFPNPSNGGSTLEIQSLINDVFTLSITDLSGRVIECHTIHIQEGSQQIALLLHSQGVYIVRLQNERQSQIIKWVIE